MRFMTNIGKYEDTHLCGVCGRLGIVWQQIDCTMPGHDHKGYACQFHVRKIYQCCRGYTRRLNLTWEEAMASMGVKVKMPKRKRGGLKLAKPNKRRKR